MAANSSRPVLLVVRGFKDRGGLPRFGRDANQHRQFAEGLVRYLSTEGKGRFFIGAAPRDTGVRVLILEGELSRTEQEQGGGSYLCVLRLKDEETGRWVGQWAGTADNFRFLYGNLTGAQGVSPQGLLGTLGDAVIGFIVNDTLGLVSPVRLISATEPI